MVVDLVGQGPAARLHVADETLHRLGVGRREALHHHHLGLLHRQARRRDDLLAVANVDARVGHQRLGGQAHAGVEEVGRDGREVDVQPLRVRAYRPGGRR